MKITRINHISVNCDGIEEGKVRSFYEGLLGLELGNHLRPKEFSNEIPGDWYLLDDSRLHVFDYVEGKKMRMPGKPQPGGPHFALFVENLDQAVEQLDTLSIPYWSHGDAGDRQVWILDPAGNTVELGQDPATLAA